MIIAFVKDISSELTAFTADQLVKTKQMDVKKRFCYIIKMYTDIKQLSKYNERHELHGLVKLLK